MSTWWEYRGDFETAFQRVWLMQATPAEALHVVQVRAQKQWDRAQQRARLQADAGFERGAVRGDRAVRRRRAAAGLVAAPAVARAAGRGERSVRANVSLRKGLLFSSPWILGLLAFLAYPLAASIIYSFCDYSVLSPPRWVGLQNFADMLSDEVFWIALKNTLLYVVLALPLGMLFAFVAALMLDAGVRGSGIYRTLVFLPSLTPVVASAMTWIWIFNSQYGVLNHWLQQAVVRADLARSPGCPTRTWRCRRW